MEGHREKQLVREGKLIEEGVEREKEESEARTSTAFNFPQGSQPLSLSVNGRNRCCHAPIQAILINDWLRGSSISCPCSSTLGCQSAVTSVLGYNNDSKHSLCYHSQRQLHTLQNIHSVSDCLPGFPTLCSSYRLWLLHFNYVLLHNSQACWQCGSRDVYVGLHYILKLCVHPSLRISAPFL